MKKGFINFLEMIIVVVVLLVAFSIFFPGFSYRSGWSDAQLLLKNRDLILAADRTGQLHNYSFNSTNLQSFLDGVLGKESGFLTWAQTDGTIKSDLRIACNCSDYELNNLISWFKDLRINGRKIEVLPCYTNLEKINPCLASSDVLFISGYKNLAGDAYFRTLKTYMENGGGIVEMSDIKVQQLLLDQTHTKIFGLKVAQSDRFDTAAIYDNFTRNPYNATDIIYGPWKYFYHIPVPLQTTNVIASSGSTDWWNSNWQYRRRFTFDNSAQSQPLNNFTVLVKLSPSNFDYSKAKSDGTDLRFIDPDNSELKYHIEKWNTTGESFIWVKVPNIPVSSNSDHMWMYYGNPSAANSQGESGTYDSNYVGVWHLGESSGTIYDSTSNNNDGTSSGGPIYWAKGTVGNAIGFDGVNDRIDVANSLPLRISGYLTISAWVYWKGSTDLSFIIEKGNNDDDNYGLSILSNGALRFEFTNTAGSWVYFDTPASTVTPSTWQHVAVTYDDTNNMVYFYKDGGLIYNPSTTYSLKSSQTYNLHIGCEYFNPGIVNFFNGTIDEVRLSKVSRSSPWIAASYLSMKDQFIAYGSEESYAAGSGSTSPPGDPGFSTRVCSGLTTGNFSIQANVTGENQGYPIPYQFWICDSRYVYFDTDLTKRADVEIQVGNYFYITDAYNTSSKWMFQLNYINGQSIGVSFKSEYKFHDFVKVEFGCAVGSHPGNPKTKDNPPSGWCQGNKAWVGYNALSPAREDVNKILVQANTVTQLNEPLPAVLLNQTSNMKAAWISNFTEEGVGDDERLLMISVLLWASNKRLDLVMNPQLNLGYRTSYVNTFNKDMFEVYKFSMGLGYPF